MAYKKNPLFVASGDPLPDSLRHGWLRGSAGAFLNHSRIFSQGQDNDHGQDNASPIVKLSVGFPPRASVYRKKSRIAMLLLLRAERFRRRQEAKSSLDSR